MVRKIQIAACDAPQNGLFFSYAVGFMAISWYEIAENPEIAHLSCQKKKWAIFMFASWELFLPQPFWVIFDLSSFESKIMIHVGQFNFLNSNFFLDRVFDFRFWIFF